MKHYLQIATDGKLHAESCIQKYSHLPSQVAAWKLRAAQWEDSQRYWATAIIAEGC